MSSLALSATRRRKAKLEIDIEPIFGYEWAQKNIYSMHPRGRAVYGGRAILGKPLLSIEAEYLYGRDQEDFSTGVSAVDTDHRLKVGLRTRFPIREVFSVFLRAGAEAAFGQHVETQGVTTASSDSTTFVPYIGAGIRAKVLRNVALGVSFTAVPTYFPDLTCNYQLVGGLTVYFPNQ